MRLEDISSTMNRRVHYTDAHNFIDSEFIFTAYIVRKINGKVIRQAELKDIHSSSVIIVPLEEVEVI